MKYFWVVLGVILSWILFTALVFFLSHNFQFSLPNSFSLQNFGMFGDSFNILTSLFTGLAFSGVVISVLLQREELDEVKKEFKEQTKALNYQQQEMAIQSFDNKFFQMLNLFNNLIDSLNFKGYGQGIHEGREVFRKLKEIFEIENSTNSKKYDTIFKFYFINLYQILKYIDIQLDDFQKAKNYTNIVRAQLSKDELVLLFYNSIGVIPFSGENYKILVEKYAFFEHLTYEDLTSIKNKNIIDILLKEYDVSAFGKNEDLKTKVLDLQKNDL